MRSIVLLSGGMDSTTALGLAIEQSSFATALSVQYGSRHAKSELDAAEEVAQFYDIPHHLLKLPSELFSGGGSALMGEVDVPNEEYHDPETESPSVTVVPFRNANLISAATAFAESHNYDRVWVAVHASDAQGFAYPDCTPQFMGPMAAAVYIGTHRKVSLMVPFQWMTKAEIVTKAYEIGAPLHLTWSCYRGKIVQCGECPTCLERIKAFQEAGFIDPVDYMVEVNWPSNAKRFPGG
jgi:7-cyano-7-deazaguanine synthase